MEDSMRPLPVPRPRSFPIAGDSPGPRCGHTLTAIAGPEGDLSKARLVLFGGATALEGSGSNKGGGEGAPSSPGPAASGTWQMYSRVKQEKSISKEMLMAGGRRVAGRMMEDLVSWLQCQGCAHVLSLADAGDVLLLCNASLRPAAAGVVP